MTEATPDGLNVEAAQVAPPPAVPATSCWRCGKPVPFDRMTCPACEAPQGQIAAQPRDLRTRSGAIVALMLWAVAIQLAVSVTLGLYVRSTHPTAERTRLALIGMAEGIDSAVVVIAVWLFARARVPSPLPAQVRPSVWIWSWPALALLVAAGHAYQELLRGYLGIAPRSFVPSKTPELQIAWVIVICVQPAIFEELCFRGLVLRALAPVMNLKIALLIASATFAVAHLGVVLSVPYLFLCGLLLGVARIASGGLVLPMLLHLAHNASVLWILWHR